MVYSVIQAAAHSSGAVRVESPAVLFPFRDGFANVIVMPNHYAFPFFRSLFHLSRCFQVSGSEVWINLYGLFHGRVFTFSFRLLHVLLGEQSVLWGE